MVSRRHDDVYGVSDASLTIYIQQDDVLRVYDGLLKMYR